METETTRWRPKGQPPGVTVTDTETGSRVSCNKWPTPEQNQAEALTVLQRMTEDQTDG